MMVKFSFLFTLTILLFTTYVESQPSVHHDTNKDKVQPKIQSSENKNEKPVAGESATPVTENGTKDTNKANSGALDQSPEVKVLNDLPKVSDHTEKKVESVPEIKTEPIANVNVLDEKVVNSKVHVTNEPVVNEVNIHTKDQYASVQNTPKLVKEDDLIVSPYELAHGGDDSVKLSSILSFIDRRILELTILEVLQIFYEIFRTPFLFMRFKFPLYARIEKIYYHILFYKLPSISKRIFNTLCSYWKTMLHYAYVCGFETCKGLYRSTTSLKDDIEECRETMDLSVANYLGITFGEPEGLLLRLKMYFYRHFVYARTALFYVVKNKRIALEPYYTLYSSQFIYLFKASLLCILGNVTVVLNLLVEDNADADKLNLYTRNSMSKLIYFKDLIIDKVDSFLEYTFNYATHINPELLFILPKDLRNRILFIFAVTFVTLILLLTFRSFVQITFAILRFTKSHSLYEMLKYYYDRSFYKRFLQAIRKSSHYTPKISKRRRIGYKYFEKSHRMFDDYIYSNNSTNITNDVNLKHNHE